MNECKGLGDVRGISEEGRRVWEEKEDQGEEGRRGHYVYSIVLDTGPMQFQC